MRSPLVLGCLFLLGSLSLEAQPLLQSGDRVAIVGNTLIERARLYGHLESALQLAPGPEVTGLVFRNLGWSADSVFGDSRSYFGPPEEGRERLGRNLAEIKPQVVFLCYGTGEAMSVDQGWTEERSASDQSASGLEQSLALFQEAYQSLIEHVRNSSGDGLRELILVSPPPLENRDEFLPDQTQNNRNLAAFRDAIRDLADKNDARFIDLFGALRGDDFDGEIAKVPLTNNGIHFTETGYQIVAREWIKELGYDESILANRDPAAFDEFRSAIVEKNRLFFHRWRPANETYLFLFRKHEQGQNAKEIPMFDPLIKEQEDRIATSRSRVLSGNTKN